MSAFFARRDPAGVGLALFLNAGDPPLGALMDLILLLDACRVDCLELAIPFPDSVSDGPVIQRSARRALEHGVGPDAVLDFLCTVRPHLSHLRIALLADWSHTVKAVRIPEFVQGVRAAGADALLVHGLPPRLRPSYYETARLLGQPVVTTCYATSTAAVLADAGRNASAYVYLAAHYGRTGSAPADYAALTPVVAALRQCTATPVAVGFGIRERAHLAAVGRAGADAAIVGSACVARVEQALVERRDVVTEIRGLLRDLGRSAP